MAVATTQSHGLRSAGRARLSAFSLELNRSIPPIREECDKRQTPRRSLRCGLTMTTAPGDGAPRTVPAECCNFGNGGLYAIVPIGYGVAIGQRYTFEMSIVERGPEPGVGQVISQQGEIVRAELLLGEDGHGDKVGIGVRLIGPRTGSVPMAGTA